MMQVPPGQIALGIMCKVPRSGLSKTRLCPPLSADEAAEFSRCFIADLAASIDGLSQGHNVRGVAVYTPANAEDELDDVLPPGFARLAQRGNGLGERLHNATTDLLDAGYQAACLINSDSPTLPSRILIGVIEALRTSAETLVLGPSIDGGYTLIGLQRPHGSLFQDIAWSTNGVMVQTLARAAVAGLPVSLLPLWYDVDDVNSLQLLLQELFGGGIGLHQDPSRPPAASRSRAFLAQLLAEGGRPGLSLPARPAPP
jgi:rSAM/selenodomain-associated transferase 1